MIFKELLDVCTVENVIEEIPKQFSEEPIDKKSLPRQVNQIMDQMRAETNYLIFDNEYFCFMAVPKGDKENSMYVGLYDIKEEDISGGWEKYRIEKVRNWGFGLASALGVTVFEPSLKKYGADCIVAGVVGALIVYLGSIYLS